MKILAIRGKNLASLAGEFDVDFTAEPLASAGLYAITGATGAGKSTLLDALCLALYERTPRLARAGAQGEGVPDVGEHSVGPGDPRTILRRGAAEGFAEVDFVGSDGVAYRARWSVRRARGKTGGRLQASELGLLRLADQQALGDHRKSETLKLIERCIGLSFEQFTRAVLLAQNDFAAFLKASDDERAELLQTLTGSQTYTRISMLAFARSRAEGEAVKLLKAQLADQLPLAEDARAAKAAELAARELALKAGEQQKMAIEAQLRWHQQAQKLAASVALATQQLAAAQLAKQQATARQAQFARIEAVQPARALVVDEARLAGEIGASTTALKVAQVSLAQASRRVDAGQGALVAATRQLQSAEQASAAAQPTLDQAKALDAQIAVATPNCLAALKARDEAGALLAREQARQQSLSAELGAVQGALQEAARWLVEQAPQRPLADGWQRWETLLAQASAFLGDSRRTRAHVTALATQHGALVSALARAAAEQAARASADQAATQALEQLSRACAAFKADELAPQRQMLEARRALLASAGMLDKDLSEQQRCSLQLTGQQPAHLATLAACATQIADCAAARPLAEHDLAAAEKVLRGAELAASASVEQLRRALEAGEACPVCGSLEHPYAQHNPPLAAVLGGLRDEVGRLRAALSELQQHATAATVLQQATQTQLAQLDREIAAVALAVRATQAQWAAHPLAAERGAVDDRERSAWLAARHAALQASLAQLAEHEAAYRAALLAKDAAQAASGQAQTALGAARDAWLKLDLEQQKSAVAGAAARQALADLERQLGAVQSDLDAAFSDASWRAQWNADPAAFVARCRVLVEAWATRQRQVSERSARIATLAASQQAAADAVANAVRHFAAQAEQGARLEGELLARQGERKSLFDGLPASAVEAGLGAAIAKTRSELAARQNESQQAAALVARHGEGQRLTGERLAAQQILAAAARQALEHWLQDFNARHPVPLERAALGDLLLFDSDWVNAERQALQALDGAIASAQAVFKAHQLADLEHRLGKPGEESAERLQQALDQLLAGLAPARAQLAALALDLARDDERRTRVQALLGDLAAQTARARVWAQLGELIGSADGKKFRNFAQQLTLDILLGYANRHLETLSRRYRLQRIGDSLGLLVVDQDMGDELRSVHSLSGGESFLVSLALALGLASLSSHRVSVESLFIDEGFGSLDADALGVAMAALDSLQAQGRKVGVISHVPEMSERIGTQIQVKRLPGGQSRVLVAP